MTTLTQLFNSLRSHVGFTMATVLTLGASWGACLAVVVLLQSSFLRPPPFDRADDLVWIRGDVLPTQRVATALFSELKRDFRDQYQVSGYTVWAINRHLDSGAGSSAYVDLSIATVDLWDTLRVPAFLGRTFVEEDDHPGGPTPVVITYRLWSTLFAADAGAIDRVISLAGEPARLIGVLPPGVHGPSNAEEYDAFIPFGRYNHVFSDVFLTNLNFRTMAGVARIAPEVNRRQLAEEVESFWAGFLERNPEAHPYRSNVLDWRTDTI